MDICVCIANLLGLRHGLVDKDYLLSTSYLVVLNEHEPPLLTHPLLKIFGLQTISTQTIASLHMEVLVLFPRTSSLRLSRRRHVTKFLSVRDKINVSRTNPSCPPEQLPKREIAAKKYNPEVFQHECPGLEMRYKCIISCGRGNSSVNVTVFYKPGFA